MLWDTHIHTRPDVSYIDRRRRYGLYTFARPGIGGVAGGVRGKDKNIKSIKHVVNSLYPFSRHLTRSQRTHTPHPFLHFTHRSLWLCSLSVCVCLCVSLPFVILMSLSSIQMYFYPWKNRVRRTCAPCTIWWMECLIINLCSLFTYRRILWVAGRAIDNSTKYVSVSVYRLWLDQTYKRRSTHTCVRTYFRKYRRYL